MGHEYYLVAGEPSGDRHAATLARALKQCDPGATISGVGGRHLRSAGQKQLFDLASHAVVGLVDVIKNYASFRRMFYQVLNDVAERQPDVVVLIDFPGFNLRLAKQLRRRHPNLKLVYYIAPQVWAWKSGRAKVMEKILDQLLVIFPFERKWFQEYAPQLPVEWVGHPTLDEWDQTSMVTWEERDDVLMLLPGSRQREIDAHLPVFLEGVRQLHPLKPEMRFVLLAPDAHKAERIKERIEEEEGLPSILVEDGYHLTRLSHARLAWVASGTATLECAMAGLPMLVIYKTQPLTWWVGRQLVKLKWLSMVNVVAGEKVVPEFLQNDARPEVFKEASIKLLGSENGLQRLHDDLVELTAPLAGNGASSQAAQEILGLLTGGVSSSSASSYEESNDSKDQR
ncbi:MAG: lipid-A-disaccharide synthase [Verrucomicrobiota bacterium]